MVNLTGWTDGQPSRVGTSYPDAAGGVSAAFSIVAALRHARRTGKGQWIDLGQTLTAVALTDTAVIEYTVNGAVQQRNGDLHRFFAPHNVYPCSGEDQWCAISVENDADFVVLANAIEQPHLAQDARFVTNVARIQHRKELDDIISAWTEQYEHNKARGYMESFDHPVAGEKRYPGVPFKMSETPGYIHRPAPSLGADTEHVLKNILGMSDQEIKQLDDAGVLV